jgi:hypothetical protein
VLFHPLGADDGAALLIYRPNSIGLNSTRSQQPSLFARRRNLRAALSNIRIHRAIQAHRFEPFAYPRKSTAESGV